MHQLNLSTLFSADENSNFHILWEESERVLCRGENRASGGLRGVLAVLPAVEHPAPATLDRLAYEYELKDALDQAWAVRLLELVRQSGRTVQVLDDPGGQPLDRRLGGPMEVAQFLRLAISLSAALTALFITKPSPASWQRASTRRAALKSIPMPTCERLGSAPRVGEPTERCGSWISSIRTCETTNPLSLQPARSVRRLNTNTLT